MAKEKQINCNYKLCQNLGVAVDPVKHNGRFYCKTCLDEILKNEEIQKYNAQLRKKIMDTVLEILPKEIPSLINKVVTQWVGLGYSMEYILYTIKYIQFSKGILNHVQGIRYYMNKDEIKIAYKKRENEIKLKEIKKEGFGTSKDEVEFTYKSNDTCSNITDLW